MTDSDTPRGSALRRRPVMVASALAVVAGIAGCSSADSEPPRSSPSTTAATPITQAPASTTNGATVTAIKTAYIKFFNPATTVNESVTLLQNGPAFRGTLERQAKTSFAKTTTATVSTVTLNSPNKATVVYSILLSGTPVLVNTTGSAVHESGGWKVAGATFCGLLAAQGPPPPVCAQATATLAPN
jgi:hypothetical protein